MSLLYAQRGVRDIAVLSSRGRGQKPEQRRKPRAGSTGAEDRSSSLEVLPQG